MLFSKTNHFVKKFLITLVIISLFSFSVPQKAQAQYTDIAQAIKEFGLDTIAYTAAQIILKKLTAKTVNWINSGFKGNPAYVTNPKQFFLDVGDDVAGTMLSSTQLNALCSPFKAQVRLALVKNYISEDDNFSCTLTTLKNNYEAFTGNFKEGGWDGWFEVTQNSGGNPFGVYLSAQNQLLRRVNDDKEEVKTELVQGKGILSLKRCIKGTVFTQADIDRSPAQAKQEGWKVGDCLATNKETVTPGSIINDQMTKSLGSTWDKLGAADEISEIMGALITQLVEKTITSVKGLRGTSEKDANGQSPVDEFANAPEPTARVDADAIQANGGKLNCTVSGGSAGSSGTLDTDTDGDGVNDTSSTGGGGGSGGGASCVSEPPSTVFPSVADFGGGGYVQGGGAGGGGSCPVPTTPKSLCENVDQAKVLAILNKYKPSNNGITAAIIEVQTIYPDAKVLSHPVRLDKIDFGGGLVVDVIEGAIGTDPAQNGSPDKEGKGWTWGIDCACGNTGTTPGT